MQEKMKKLGERTEYYRSAITLDGKNIGRKPYYSKPEELMARGFEIYVLDKMKEKGIVNDYLVSSIKGKMGDRLKDILEKAGIKGASPYLEGAERRQSFHYYNMLVEQMKESGIVSPLDRSNENGIEVIDKIKIGETEFTIEKDTSSDNKLKYMLKQKNGEDGESVYYEKLAGLKKHSIKDIYSAFASIIAEEKKTWQENETKQTLRENSRTTAGRKM
jgi:hypothetical protein